MIRVYLVRQSPWQGQNVMISLASSLSGNDNWSRPLLLLDGQDSPVGFFALRDDMHDWLVERDQTYKVRFTCPNVESVMQGQVHSYKAFDQIVYDIWVEIDDPQVAMLFKLTWCGRV